MFLSSPPEVASLATPLLISSFLPPKMLTLTKLVTL